MFVAFCLVILGCSPSRPAPTQVDEATALLQKCLDCWKRGVTVAEMRKLTPPIYVADDMWMGGFKLTEFNFAGTGEPFGTNVRFEVAIKGTSPNGGLVQRTVKYLVATTPAKSVARDDR